MKWLVLYIHGKGGSPLEAEHYKPLFLGYDVVGFDYYSDTPWDAVVEFKKYLRHMKKNMTQLFSLRIV